METPDFTAKLIAKYLITCFYFDQIPATDSRATVQTENTVNLSRIYSFLLQTSLRCKLFQNLRNTYDAFNYILLFFDE